MIIKYDKFIVKIITIPEQTSLIYNDGSVDANAEAAVAFTGLQDQPYHKTFNKV